MTPWVGRRLMRRHGLTPVNTPYMFFFPRLLRWMRWMEPALRHVPMGAQYLILSRRGAGATTPVEAFPHSASAAMSAARDAELVRAAAVEASPTDRTYWLIVAWNRATDEYKYFVSNAPPQTDLSLLLKVAFQRTPVEHLFRLAKSEVGLSHFEGRSYVGLMRHMILCQLIVLFLAEQTGRINAQNAVSAAAADALANKKNIRAGVAPAPSLRN